MMHTDAPHPNCAYLWMEHSLDPKVQGDLASWFGSVPAVPAACEGNELLGPEGCVTNGIDELRPDRVLEDPAVRLLRAGLGCVCVPYQQWVTNYVAVIGGR